MKPILLFLLGLACLRLIAQTPTTITGPFLDSSGAPANCTLTITPKKLLVPNVSATVIGYVIVNGDLAGTTGGYGASQSRITRAQPLKLSPGQHSVFQSCAGQIGSATYTWNVPNASTVTIQALNGGVPVLPLPPSTGTYCLTSTNGTVGPWAACGGASPSYASWDLLTSAWDSYAAGWDTYH